MKQEDFSKAKIIDTRITLYQGLEKLLLASGVSSFSFLKPIEDDIEEQKVMKDELLKIVQSRIEQAKQEFDNL